DGNSCAWLQFLASTNRPSVHQGSLLLIQAHRGGISKETPILPGGGRNRSGLRLGLGRAGRRLLFPLGHVLATERGDAQGQGRNAKSAGDRRKPGGSPCHARDCSVTV